MGQRTKLFATFAESVADVPDGSVVAFGGFAGPGTPYNLTRALLEQGARDLTCIANSRKADQIGHVELSLLGLIEFPAVEQELFASQGEGIGPAFDAFQVE